MLPSPQAPSARGGGDVRPTLRLPSTASALVTFLLATAAAASLAAAPPQVTGDLPLDQVSAGMKGYGVTAGPDNKLVQFPVEVLSVQTDAGPGFPLVLIRASGSFIAASGGVSAGMSGSPVYLGTPQGPQLLGAVSYVFPSADHDLALVTPIGVMRASAAGASAPGAGPVAVAGIGTAVAAATPILLSGVDPRAAALLAPLFRDPRLTPFPVQAAGAVPQGQQPAYQLQPGSPISVELVTGDVTIGAVGTVTAVHDGHLLAFGHPLLGLGRVALPAAPAFVTAIVPSSVVPFKLANSGRKPIGTITQDRPGAVAGTVGAGPAMIPVSLTVDAPSGATTYHFDVAADERLYPQLVAAASLQLLDRSLAETTGGYAQVGWEIGLGGGDQLNLVEQADDPADIARAAAELIGSPLQTLANNDFRAPGLHALTLNVSLSTTQNTAHIVNVVAENPKVKAGTAVIVHVGLQPYRKPSVVRTVSVTIPKDAPAGPLTLTIRGGDVTPKGKSAEPPAKSKPRSFLELLDAMREKPQASDLVVEAPDKHGNAQRLARLSLPYVVTGSETLDVTVENGAKPAAGGSKGAGNGGEASPPPPSSQPPDLNQPPGGSPPQPPGPTPNGGGAPSGGSTGEPWTARVTTP